MGPLQIPDVFVPGFVALAELGPEPYGRLAEALADGPLTDQSLVAERVVAPATGLEARQADELVAALTSLSGYHRRSHETLDAVAVGVSESPALAALDQPQRDALAQRLRQLLGTRVVSGGAKALDLQHHRHAVGAVHVVTETRFLFDDTADLDPSAIYGAVVSHTLRIQTYDDDRDTIFSLTDADLHALRAELDRAARKREVIGDRLRGSGIAIYGEAEEAST